MDGKYWDCSWNPLKVIMGYHEDRPILSGYHCEKVSPGCQNCWAEKYNMRFGNGGPYIEPANPPLYFALDKKVLEAPLHWKNRRIIFVCDLCDLFFEEITCDPRAEVYGHRHFDFIFDILEIAEKCPQHTFLFLTKRPKRLREAQSYLYNGGEGWLFDNFPNIWWGLTVCNQFELDTKIEDFLLCNGKLWLSIEPLLDKINLDASPQGDILSKCEECGDEHDDNCEMCLGLNRIRQIIVGGETGPKARPVHPDWVRKIRDDCQAADVPFFMKQWGEYRYADYFENKELQAMAIGHGDYWFSNNCQYCGYPASVGLGIDGLSNFKQKTIIIKDGEPPETIAFKIGKKRAGRLLDGHEHNDLIWAV